MKHIKRLGYIAVIILMVVALTLSCAPKPAPPVEPIKIGALLALTGYMAETGPVVQAAIEYRLDQVGWEVAGRKIELIIEDCAADPVIAVDKAKKLVEADRVDVILGPLNSAAAFAVADYLTESRTPNMCFLQHSIGVLQFGGGNVFMHFGTLMGTGYPLGLYAYDELGYRTATVAYDDFVSGEEFTGGAIQGFEERGGTIVQRQAIPMGTMDFSSYLVAMKKADCVFFWFTPATCQRFVMQYYDHGLKMPLLLSGAMVLFEPLLAAIGDRALGMVGSLPYTALIDTDINKRYVDAFVERYGFAPPAESLGGDVGLTMYLEAVKATGGDITPEKIFDALHKIKVDTPAGTISYTPEGLGIADFYICEVTKIGDRYAWEVIKKISQIVIDVPK